MPKPSKAGGPQSSGGSAAAGRMRRTLLTALKRSRAELVPPAFQDLWTPHTWHIWYGGRASGKSWSIARVLLMHGFEQPLRILCCRELQTSIRESAHKLLKDQIRVLDLEDFYDVQADRIIAANGTEFIFEGLRANYNKIRSYEGVTRLWVEEGQAVSARSWEELVPTVIRNAGVQCYVSFNPMSPDDPVWTEFVENPRPNSYVRKVSFRDNPYVAPELEAERKWLLATDPDAHAHIWDGNFRLVSDAQVLRGKYVAQEVEIDPGWAGPYHGCDFGFSKDPTAAVRCWVDDEARVLYVDREYWALGADIDALPGALEGAIHGVSRHVLQCDSARPETISYLTRNGVPNARAAEKWPGSVDDGVAYLRSFARIVIDPQCRHLLDECVRYSYKQDRLTGQPLPELLDAHNHLIDALRYALSPLIRNQPTGGYFNRSALLIRGEPVEPPREGEAGPKRVFATMATSDQPGTAVGVVYFAHSPRWGLPLTVVDWDLFEVDALRPDLIAALLARGHELVDEWKPLDDVFRIYAEEGELYQALEGGLLDGLMDDPVLLAGGRPPYDLVRIESKRLVSCDSRQPVVSLPERANDVRTVTNQGQTVKLARGAYIRQRTHRSSTTNHLLSQILSFRPDARDAAQELVAAFALGVLSARDPGAPAAMPAPEVALPDPETAAEQPAAPVGPWGPGPWTGYRIP